MTDYWSEEEIEMLFSDMTNEEIEQKTGRSKSAVRWKRYQKTGHYVEKKNHRDLLVHTYPKSFVSDFNKKARIITLAQKPGVKLFG